MAADHFVEENYNVAVIENHNGDPYATDTSNGRNSYYGIGSFPTGVFDGMLSYVGGSNTTSNFSSYLPLYNQRVNIKTPVSIELFGSNEGAVYTINAKINKLANLAYENLAFQLAITQSDIQYSWQGQSEFNFVNMMMVPDRFGTTVDLKNAPIGIFTLPLTFTAGSSWNLANCEFVAFVQNNDTREVLQAYKVMVNDLPANPSANDDMHNPGLRNALHGNYPNPFNPETTISYSVAGDSPVAIEIYNTKGQLVKTLVNDQRVAGDYSVVWNGMDNNNNAVASGLYYSKMSAGKYSSTKKMIMMK